MQHAPLPVRASRVRTRGRSAAFANSKTTRRHEVWARSSAEKVAGVHLLDDDCEHAHDGTLHGVPGAVTRRPRRARRKR